MESNGQNELTSKIETDSWIESRLTAVGGGDGDGGIKQKRKKRKLIDTDNTVVISKGRGMSSV